MQKIQVNFSTKKKMCFTQHFRQIFLNTSHRTIYIVLWLCETFFFILLCIYNILWNAVMSCSEITNKFDRSPCHYIDGGGQEGELSKYNNTVQERVPGDVYWRRTKVMVARASVTVCYYIRWQEGTFSVMGWWWGGAFLLQGRDTGNNGCRRQIKTIPKQVTVVATSFPHRVPTTTITVVGNGNEYSARIYLLVKRPNGVKG